MSAGANGNKLVQLVERDDEDLRRQQVAGGEDHQAEEVEPPAKRDTAKRSIDETNSVMITAGRR